MNLRTKVMKPTHYDLVILGSGSTAFAAASRAQELGKTSVMTEEGMGWPHMRQPRLSAFQESDRGGKDHSRCATSELSWTDPAELGLDFRKLIEQKDEIIHDYRHKKYESLTDGQFTIEEGNGEFAADSLCGILPP
jgi:mercuric reductase